MYILKQFSQRAEMKLVHKLIELTPSVKGVKSHLVLIMFLDDLLSRYEYSDTPLTLSQ